MVLPSLSDTVLLRLGALVQDAKPQTEEVINSEKDIQNKFTSLMLAFKTDKLTLERRLELQRRLRDQAELNMAAELTNLKAAVQLLSPLCTDSEKIELLEKVGDQVEALHKSTYCVSTSAEMYGAVQQENRLSKAVDIVLRHVENLKQAYDKEKTDHDETRKVLSDNSNPSSAALKMQCSKRRASIATLTRAQHIPSPDPGRSPTLPSEGRAMSRVRLGSLPRKVTNTIVEAEQEEQPGPSPQPHLPNDVNVRNQSEEVMESGSSPGPSATSSLQHKASRSASISIANSGDTGSEDESSAQEPLPPTPTHLTASVDRPVSWALSQCQLSERLEWAHLRYSVAIALLIAALAIFTSTFILPHTRHT